MISHPNWSVEYPTSPVPAPKADWRGDVPNRTNCVGWILDSIAISTRVVEIYCKSIQSALGNAGCSLVDCQPDRKVDIQGGEGIPSFDSAPGFVYIEEPADCQPI